MEILIQIDLTLFQGYDDNPSYAQGYFNGNDIEQPPEFHQNYENPRFDDRMRNNYDEQDKIPKEMPEPLPVPEALTGDKGVVFKKDGLQYRKFEFKFKRFTHFAKHIYE